MKRIFIFLMVLFALCMSSCGTSEDNYACENCEEYFAESKLVYIEYGDKFVCYKCAFENTITCPTCNEHIWYQKYDWLSDVHPQHITMCCNCDCEYLYQLIELQDENGTIHNICPECYNYKYFTLSSQCDYH